jgi:hypothetical protein
MSFTGESMFVVLSLLLCWLVMALVDDWLQQAPEQCACSLFRQTPFPHPNSNYIKLVACNLRFLQSDSSSLQVMVGWPSLLPYTAVGFVANSARVFSASATASSQS